MAGVINMTNQASRSVLVTPPPASVPTPHRTAPTALSVLEQVCPQATGTWHSQGKPAGESAALAQRDPMTGVQGSGLPGYRRFAGTKPGAVAVSGAAHSITVPTITVPTTVREDEHDPGPTVWSPPV